MHVPHFLYPFGHLGRVHVLAIVNSAAVNTGVRVPFAIVISEHVPSVRFPGHMVVLSPVFEGLSVLFPMVLHPFTPPPTACHASLILFVGLRKWKSSARLRLCLQSPDRRSPERFMRPHGSVTASPAAALKVRGLSLTTVSFWSITNMQDYNSLLSFHPEIKDRCQVSTPNHLQKQVPLPTFFFVQ